MAKQMILVPDIGDYSDVPVIEVLVKVGDVIEKEQPLLVLESDKATMEVEAVDEGVIGKIMVAAGTEAVKVNQLIALLLEDGEDAAVLASYVPKAGTTPAAQETKAEEKKELLIIEKQIQD